MSAWDTYLSSLHLECATIARSAIIAYPSGEVWARSKGANACPCTDTELAAFVKCFDDLGKVLETGVDLGGSHYIVPRAEKNFICGKTDEKGFFAFKIKTAVILVGYNGATDVTSDVRDAVEKLADDLTSI
ncbi:hypothetical protein PFISCL1PPCAC_22783, partial [Pristionchus fissidentatus]